MSYGSAIDPYITPQGVLKNCLGITNAGELEQTGHKLVYSRHLDLWPNPIQGNFDADHICALHRHLFQDVYPWAGQIRTIDISKGGTRFCYRDLIDANLRRLACCLDRENYLAGLSPEKFSARAAWYMGELNAIHPFREGNGRVQRAAISQLAFRNDYRLSWSHTTTERMIQASILSSHTGNNSHFASIIQQGLVPNPHLAQNLLLELSPLRGQSNAEKLAQKAVEDLTVSSRHSTEELHRAAQSFIHREINADDLRRAVVRYEARILAEQAIIREQSQRQIARRQSRGFSIGF
ncbi:MAG: Fic family protein [Opitutaceae bacterium]|jgi:cell filamentation protein|nr:Fic family protein [Opitutaceae bacterium]